ncbi:unnamed protein product [Effrenium voratum]|nr:unnamed protein product [Effrenium voratum]
MLSAVASKYLAEPLLVEGRKVDLRLYVLVTRLEPLEAFVFREGLVRFCGPNYAAAGYEDLGAHISNNAVQSKGLRHAAGQNWTLQQLWEHLDAEPRAEAQLSPGLLWPRLLRLVRDALALWRPTALRYARAAAEVRELRCYSLLAFDVLVDRRGGCWLLEVNSKPALHAQSPSLKAIFPVHFAVKSALLADLFSLVGLPRYHGEEAEADGDEAWGFERLRFGPPQPWLAANWGALRGFVDTTALAMVAAACWDAERAAKSRPRLIPEPEVMSREVKAQPVPAGIHKNSLSKVEEQRKKKLEEEKARVQSKYTESDHFSLETGARRDHEAEMELLKKKVEEEQMAECTFNPKTSKKVVAPDDATVRHNVASVLREDALLKQKQAKEYQILKRYEEDLHDASQFHSWQEKMKEKDHLEEEARVRQRIMEMQLARESAMESFDSAVRRKHIVAEHQREELQLGLELKEKEKECELGEKKMLVEETKEVAMRLARRSSSPPPGPGRRAQSPAPGNAKLRAVRNGTGSWGLSQNLRRPSRSASPAPRPKAGPSGSGPSGSGSALGRWRAQSRKRREAGAWQPPPLPAQLEAIGLDNSEEALRRVAEGKSVQILLEQYYPEKLRSSVQMQRLSRLLQPLSPIYMPILPPLPDTWMFTAQEEAQSFKDYVLEQPPGPTRLLHRVYLLPLSEANPTPHASRLRGTLPDLRMFAHFIEAWFDLPCKVLPYDGLLFGRGIASRSNGHGGDLQYHAKDSLRQLRIRLPSDGFCILGITMEDLFDSSHSFVHSSLSVQDRAGIFSFCRLDPAWYRVSCHMDFDVMKVVEDYPKERREGDLETLLRRGHQIVSHDLGHFFGLKRCQFFLCRMQGSAGLHESDTNQDKVDLCPVCLRKLSWNLACSNHEDAPTDLEAWCLQRYRKLLAHAEKLGPVLQSFKVWVRSRLAQLDLDILPAAAAAAFNVSAVKAAETTAGPWPVRSGSLEANEDEVDPIQLTPDDLARREAELLMLFARHDEDGDGKMKVKEFCQLITEVDESFSSISAMKMFEAADLNKDGSVEVKEFLQWLLCATSPGEAEVRILKRLAAPRPAESRLAGAPTPDELDEDRRICLPQRLENPKRSYAVQASPRLILISDRVRARAAEQEALKDRANNADNMRKEREVELERKKREDEQEMERKRDLIREIRALEKVPVERAKLFDPAEPPCQGLLEEMSLAELKERLRIVTAQKEKELDMKRERPS